MVEFCTYDMTYDLLDLNYPDRNTGYLVDMNNDVRCEELMDEDDLRAIPKDDAWKFLADKYHYHIFIDYETDGWIAYVKFDKDDEETPLLYHSTMEEAEEEATKYLLNKVKK